MRLLSNTCFSFHHYPYIFILLHPHVFLFHWIYVYIFTLARFTYSSLHYSASSDPLWKLSDSHPLMSSLYYVIHSLMSKNCCQKASIHRCVSSRLSVTSVCVTSSPPYWLLMQILWALLWGSLSDTLILVSCTYTQRVLQILYEHVCSSK